MNEHPQTNQINRTFCHDLNKTGCTSLLVCGSNIMLESHLQFTAPHLAFFPTLPYIKPIQLINFIYFFTLQKNLSEHKDVPITFHTSNQNPLGILTGIKQIGKFKAHIT